LFFGVELNSNAVAVVFYLGRRLLGGGILAGLL
jgi:hypothetical protein